MVTKKTTTKATKPKTFSQALAKKLFLQGVDASLIEVACNVYQDNGSYSPQGLVGLLRYLSQGDGDYTESGWLKITAKTYKVDLNDFAHDLATDEEVREELLNSLS